MTNSEEDIYAVEEDWEITLMQPNEVTSSPQISTQMYPNKDIKKNYGIFNVNFQQIPVYVDGGIELQLWEDDWSTDINGQDGEKLHHVNETVTWTQRMRVLEDHLLYRIKTGTSQSFGDFGGLYFWVSSREHYTNLNNYDVTSSVENSGVTFGSNRVKTMKLLAVRKYKENGEVITDDTDRIVLDNTSNSSGSP